MVDGGRLCIISAITSMSLSLLPPTESSTTKETMAKKRGSDLVFIPFPGAGHLTPALRLAQQMVDRDRRLSATILLLRHPMQPPSPPPDPGSSQLRLVPLPMDDASAKKLLDGKSSVHFLSSLVDFYKPQIRAAIADLTLSSPSFRPSAFILDLFCTPAMEVAEELAVPSFIFFTSGAAFLSLLLHAQYLHDHHGHDITSLKDSFSLPSFLNPLPVTVLPSMLLDKDGGGYAFSMKMAREFRKTKGILVNTFEELEPLPLHYLRGNDHGHIPAIYPVGPVINLDENVNEKKKEESHVGKKEREKKEEKKNKEKEKKQKEKEEKDEKTEEENQKEEKEKKDKEKEEKRKKKERKNDEKTEEDNQNQKEKEEKKQKEKEEKDEKTEEENEKEKKEKKDKEKEEKRKKKERKKEEKTEEDNQNQKEKEQDKEKKREEEKQKEKKEKGKGKKKKKDENEKEVMEWLGEQPEGSVVFLCFGSMGKFSEEQGREVAEGLERSGERFLWCARGEEEEEGKEVVPSGFVDRCGGKGKVTGWAPQVAVLSHPAVGGFVSHCGWNSTLESLWFGVPVATWPFMGEQQLNAFQLVRELGAAMEMSLDYNKPVGKGASSVLGREVVEKTVRRLMGKEEEGVVRNVAELSRKSRLAVSQSGSSFSSLGQFIDDVVSHL